MGPHSEAAAAFRVWGAAVDSVDPKPGHRQSPINSVCYKLKMRWKPSDGHRKY